MKIEIKRIDTSLPLPEYKSDGAVAFDIYAREGKNIKAQQTAFVPTNLIIKVPQGHALLLFGRSGLPKRGLMMANSVGVIDQDFHGPEDELQLFLYNFTSEDLMVKRGDRLAQGLITTVEKAEWDEVSEHNKKDSRGGFGSTG